MPESYDRWGIPDTLGQYYPGPSGPGFPGGLWIDVTPPPPPLPPESIPIVDTRVEPPSGSDTVFDAGPATGVIPDATPDAPPVRLPDPGALDMREYAVTYPGDGPVLIERRSRRRIGRIIPNAFPTTTGVPRMNIVVGERWPGQTTTGPFPNNPSNPPAPTGGRGGPFRPQGPTPSPGLPDDFWRELARRVVRDSELRRGIGRVLEGEVIRGAARRALGPIGAVIGVMIPSPLGSGEADPRFEVPAPPIPEPVIAQPPLPETPIWEPEPLPLPGPVSTGAPPVSGSAPAPTSSSTGSPAPRPAGTPTPTPAPSRLPSPVLQGLSPWLLHRLLRSPSTRPSSWTIPTTSSTTTTTPLTSISTPVPITPGVTTGPIGIPLTSVQPLVSSSAPPRIRTSTRTRECRCDDKPKKRKKRRECTARGNLMWSSGPKKGKPAGSRCIRFVGGR